MRTAFVEETSSNLLNEATALSENYLKAEQEATELLRLDDISIEASLHRFLHDPVNELIRGLFNPLFDLLKGRIDVETFKGSALQNIEASFRDLHPSGYEKWVVLSLVKLLEADKSLQVTLREIHPRVLVSIRAGGDSPVEEVPAPEESRRLLFKHKPVVAFTAPDFIVHSAKANRYFALRSEIDRAISTASNASEKREWYPITSMVALLPSLIFIYVDDDPKEISLVADAKQICRPDLIIECRGQINWFEKDGLEKIRLHHISLKPRLGTYIVSREFVPQQAFAELEDSIYVLPVGFDQSKIDLIISALMQPENKD